VAATTPGVIIFLIGISFIGFANRRGAGLAVVSAVGSVSAVHEQVAQNHKTEKAIRNDRTNRHFEHEYGQQGSDNSG
jgi:hypothetical protein